MPSINLLNSSNRIVNNTNVLGGPKKAGLAPTTNMRPCFTKLPGYGVSKLAGNNDNSEENINACGFNKSVSDGYECLVKIGFPRQTRAERIIARLRDYETEAASAPAPAPAPASEEEEAVRVLDLTTSEGGAGGAVRTDLKGFRGGFTHGTYGYLVPNNNGDYFGKMARIDLSDFSTVDVLDLTETDSELKGFDGGFTDGTYGYLVPYSNDVGVTFGKVARIKLIDFIDAGADTVETLDLVNEPRAFDGSNLNGFCGGFTDGSYGYFVPRTNSDVARIDLNNFTFSGIERIKLAEIDSDLRGFHGGFTHGSYGYLVPNNNGDAFGTVVRINLNNFILGEVVRLDLTTVDGGSDLKGFRGGFAAPAVTPSGGFSGMYGYLVPYNNGDFFGKVVRINLNDFTSAGISILDLTEVDERLKGFIGGFAHGSYGYFVPNDNGKVARISLSDFSKSGVTLIDLTTVPVHGSDLKGFYGGFADGPYSYFVPNDNGDPFGKVVRLRSTSID